ncbi:hypothetical protein ACFP2T_35120 [Plantactinospora solaniradicis]|uniref:Peptidase inhibitor family I36 n=1 Tax=Plantactinospora solaniradicis TaxID=1723736 RepID=A0ABW1KI32_9ACTN
MTTARRISGAVFAAALGVVAALAVSGPANAAGRHIADGRGAEERCYDFSLGNTDPVLCLYWGTWDTAMFVTDVSIPNLDGKRFSAWDGGTTGANEYVKNNAATMSCMASLCTSFYNENYSGNYDYLYRWQTGGLYYTWNDGASVRMS